jgi:AraC-like DNA-binding protein
METYGLARDELPRSIDDIVRSGEVAIDAIAPGHAGAVAAEISARRGIYPSFAGRFYKSKALELVSALMAQVARRDALRAGDGAFDPKMQARLDLVKRVIEQAPGRALDVEALARMAGMNRTKLRAALKQAYGVTLSEHRSALLLERADRALRGPGCSVQEAAHLAGYAAASSFIVAYKRRYGVCPGAVAHA